MKNIIHYISSLRKIQRGFFYSQYVIIILKIHCLWTDPSHRSKLNVIITIIPRKTIRIPECVCNRWRQDDSQQWILRSRLPDLARWRICRVPRTWKRRIFVLQTRILDEFGKRFDNFPSNLHVINRRNLGI